MALDSVASLMAPIWCHLSPIKWPFLLELVVQSYSLIYIPVIEMEVQSLQAKVVKFLVQNFV